MATHLMRIFGSLVITREGREPPQDDEWESSLDQLRDIDFNNLRFLIYTEGGGPSTTQRKRLNSVLAGRRVLVAVVTDSAKVRFIVSSIALFSREIHTFTVSEIEDAYAFLSLTPVERRRAEQSLQEMGKLIG